MDVGAVSMAMSHIQMEQQASMSVMKKAMDTGEQQGDAVNKMLESSGVQDIQRAAEPHKGANIDFSR